jgi:hypothetical protein
MNTLQAIVKANRAVSLTANHLGFLVVGAGQFARFTSREEAFLARCKLVAMLALSYLGKDSAKVQSSHRQTIIGLVNEGIGQ